MPKIILKKTFKVKPGGFKVANEKSFSFHGAITPDMIGVVNQKLACLRLTGGANRIAFNVDQYGHYFCPMNHAFQKYHEEDAIVCILDAMEILGWTFRFQYDTELSSSRTSGASMTSRELFLFHKSG